LSTASNSLTAIAKMRCSESLKLKTTVGRYKQQGQ
jgi:hypothetical protein